MEMKGDDSMPQSHVIMSTPQSVIVTVVPRIRIGHSRKQIATLEGDGLSLMIEEQISAAYLAESRRLEEDVQWMRKQTRITSLRKDLLKEKDDLVWGFGQLKKEIEQEATELITRNTEAKTELEKELRHAGNLHRSSIKNELRGLANEALSIWQRASERLATATASHEPQLELIRSRIDAIEPPSNPPCIQRPLPALFGCGSTSLKDCLPFAYTGTDIFEFTHDHPNCFDRPTIVTNPETHEPSVGADFLTPWSLDTMPSAREGERMFFYQGRMFLRGLELVPIHDNRALEVFNPNVEHLIPFVQSHFDSPRIDHLFSVLHWKQGDRLSYGNEVGSWYYLHEVLWKDLLVIARKINICFGDSGLDSNTSGLDDVQLHLQWTKRDFRVGDYIEATFGPEKGTCGMLTAVTDATVTVLKTDCTDVS